MQAFGHQALGGGLGLLQRGGVPGDISLVSGNLQVLFGECRRRRHLWGRFRLRLALGLCLLLLLGLLLGVDAGLVGGFSIGAGSRVFQTVFHHHHGARVGRHRDV